MSEDNALLEAIRNRLRDANANTYSNAVLITDNTDQSVIDRRNKDLIELQKQDYSWKVNARPKYGRFLLIFLSLQNIIVFFLTWLALKYDNTALYWLFTIIVPATLIQTAFMVTTIIKWLFNDINYELIRDKSKHKPT